jgi:hypothetical protein
MSVQSKCKYKIAGQNTRPYKKEKREIYITKREGHRRTNPEKRVQEVAKK